MSNKTAKKQFTDQLITLAKKHSYYGINIDFEAVNPEDRVKVLELHSICLTGFEQETY